MKQIEEEVLERETGVEPATSSLGSLRSTPELLPLCKGAERANKVVNITGLTR